jgi:hypothetical protein
MYDIKIIPTTETEIKSIIHSFKAKNSSDDGLTCLLWQTAEYEKWQ